MKHIFPFTAIVGQDQLKLALILNAISPQIGGVLIRGDRGTAKSTAVRALAELLPEIQVVQGCRFSCDPHLALEQCDDCRARAAAEQEIPSYERKISLVTLPVSATEDRVVGTLDIERAIAQGERHFEPGVMAAANRGILYIDEVNLLDDHVVDLLLDAAAMGMNFVEREGISFSHPARFVLIGTMNPEEGDLRPQLLDRFGLCVDIHTIGEPHLRSAILRRHMEFERNPIEFKSAYIEQEQEIARKIKSARAALFHVQYSDEIVDFITSLTAQMRVDGHRADMVILRTAAALSAFEGRLTVSMQDVLTASELALPHRLQRDPFQDSRQQVEQLHRALETQRQQAELINHANSAKKKTLKSLN